MNISVKARKVAEEIREKSIKFIGAVGGRIEGVEKPGEEEAIMIRRRAGYSLAAAVGGFFFSGTSAAFGSFPFGIALFMASGHSNALFVFAGAVAGALSSGEGAMAQIIVMSLAFICRAVLSPKSDIDGRRLFEEPLKIKVLISIVSAFLLGIYSVADSLDTSLKRGIFAMLFLLVSVPLMTCVFDSVLSGRSKSAVREAGVCTILFVSVFCLAEHTFFGHSFAVSASFLIILTAGYYYGTLRGAVCGVICALACRINPVIFTLAGFAAGAFRIFGPVSATAISLVAAIGCSVYLEGLRSAYIFMGDVIFASLVFIPLAKTKLIDKYVPQNDQSKSNSFSESINEEKRRDAEKRRLTSLSEAFEELSQVFVKLSSKLRSPAAYELYELCDSVFDRYCRKCALVSYCWQKNYEDMNDGIRHLSEKMKENGSLEKKDLPGFLVARCRNIEKILWDINRGQADMVEDAVKRDKTELFALDYEAISELLKSSSADDGRFILDSALQNKTAKTIRSLGIRALAFGAWGTRCKTLLASGVEIGSIAVTSDEIRRALEVGTGLKLGQPEFNFSGEFVAMTLSSRKCFELTSASAFICAADEDVSGDSIKTFDSVADYFYGSICDGMGSGAEAASVSLVSSLFFEKMLSAGNSIPVTLKLLSNFLRARSEEYHCTADIVEVDLYSAKAAFIKCGAPPSYVLRGGNIFKVDARSMPLGITKEINAEKIEMQLADGDRVILVSDGVAPDLEDALWLPELLVSCADLSDPDLADIIVKHAKAEMGTSDDISALVLTVHALDEDA